MKDELAWLNTITLNPSRQIIAHSLFMLRDDIVGSIMPDQFECLRQWIHPCL
jgi:hypothetical protein